MKEIRYQILDGRDGKPIPSIHTAKVKPGESFEMASTIQLRRCQDMIIPDGNGGFLQPRRIEKLTNGSYRLAYGWPSRNSWSQGSMFAPINIIEIL